MEVWVVIQTTCVCSAIDVGFVETICLGVFKDKTEAQTVADRCQKLADCSEVSVHEAYFKS